MNPYLARLRDQYNAIQNSVTELQTRAAEENRDLSEDELRSVKGQDESAKKLYAEITLLTEQENRAAQVANLGGEMSRSVERSTSNTSAVDRDPGFYRSASEGGQHSFIADLVNAKNDRQAHDRLTQHSRALTSADNGVGIVPPRWMTELWTPSLRQGRVLANAVRRIDLGTDPRPISVPKQTGFTTVTEQSDSCGDVTWTDAYDTDLDTVQPKVVSGGQILCREFFDAASPAVDQLVFADLVADYDRAIEAKIAAALVAAAGAANTTFATESAFNAAGVAYDAVVDAGMGVWSARHLPADIAVMRTRRWGSFLKMKDTTGRPLFPTMKDGAQGVNVFGTGDVQSPGSIDGLAVVVTDGMGTTAYPESIVVQRSQDAILFEGTQLKFEDPYSVGPNQLRVAIWAYAATYIRYAGLSGKRVQITAA